uniref:Casein kinase II subunit beta n=1 Tax=Cyclophora tenuis TaxID=216820 RepID=A0A7S1GN37_CYCTE|mmetsp:Transcript_22563/g.38368  ORF Transcript_22563/g.38368 Transcript_22563/m.38368 type:complete len:430 (+) Transcript_22563:15-1304(+)
MASAGRAGGEIRSNSVKTRYTEGDQEDDLASIDRPMISSAKRKSNGAAKTSDGPGDLMKRLTITDNGTFGVPLDAQVGGLNNGSADIASAATGDSLEALPPSARMDGGAKSGKDIRTYTSPYGTGRAPHDPASEASQALQALQSAAVVSGPSDVQQRGGTYQRTNLSDRKASAATINDNTSQNGRDDEVVEEDEDEEEESSEISASDEDGSWITWFCSLRGNEFFCEVDEDYIQDDFNLTGLNGLVPYYDYALDMVLDVEMPMEDSLTEEQQEIVESAAEMLYGLIHARYIVTNRGMHAMYEKYRSASFGRCPHVFCQGQPVLPVGLSDLPRNYTVNVFCPRCHGLFFPKSTRQANIDGAYFGTTFPHLYLMTHPDMVPARPTQQYVPRVFGFKIHQSSLYHRNHAEGPSQIETSHRSSRKGKHRQTRK